MYPLVMTNAATTLQTSFVGIPTITTFSNGPTGPLGVTGPTNIFAHLDLPVWDSVALWLDAADPATIGLSATRGAGNYSQVSAWYDKSSNAQHLFQATAVNQPYYHPSGFNGRPGVRFGYNTAATSLTRTGPFLSGTGQLTMFLVYRFEGLNNQRIISAPGTGNTDGAADAFGFKNDKIGIQYTRGGPGHSASAGINNYQFICLSFVQNPSSATIGGIGPSNIAYFLNGVASTTFPSSLFTSNFNASNFTLFNGSPGFVAELIIYRRILLAPERQSMESYLINKWGLANSNIPVPAQQGGGVNLALWLDAADNDMLTFSNNTQNIVPTISAWFDKSGNNQHTRQSVLARQPYYEATGFNGLPGVRVGYNSTAFPINYTAQSLATNTGTGLIGGNSPAITASPNFTMFFVLKNEGMNIRFIQTQGAVSGCNTGFTTFNYDSFAVSLGCLNSAPFAQIQGVRYTGAPLYTPPSREISFREVLITSMANATSVSAGGLSSNTVGFFLNGSLVASNINPINILSNVNCCNLVIGQSTHGNSGTWQGYFAEFIIYNTVLSVTQRQAVEDYLINKWRLGTATVPVPLQYGGISPLRNLGPCLWLDANDTATVLRSTGPNTGMGNAYVQTWFDKSGREFYVTQATAANRPYYDATGFNGRPTIRFGATGATGLTTVPNVFFAAFPGTSNFLGTGDILNEMTMFAVMRMDLDLQTTGRMLSAVGAISGVDNSSIGDGFLFFYQQNAGSFGQIKYASGLPLNLGCNFMLSFVANSNSSNIGGVGANSYQNFINGAPSQSGTLTGTSASNFSTLALMVGAFGTNVAQSGARFALSELIIYGRSLRGSERSNVESYLTNKWAITSASQAAPFQVGTTSQPLYRSLAAWYDAADVATVGLFNTTCNSVANWYDKTGRGFTLTPAGTGAIASAPYYNPRGFSSLPTIQFSGNRAIPAARPNVSIRNTNFRIFNTAACNALTYFLVCKYETSFLNNGRLISFFCSGRPNDNNDGIITANMRYNGGTGGFACEGVPNINNLPSQPGSNVLYTISINYTSNTIGQIPAFTSLGFVNGSLIPSATNTNSNRRYLSTTMLTLGTAFYDAGVIASIPECLIYTSTLGTTDQRNIESYLMNKWSISTPTVTLPAPNTILTGLSMWLDADDYYLLRLTNASVTNWIDKAQNGLANAFINNIRGTGQNFPLYFSTSWVTYSNVVKPTIRFDASLRTIISGPMDQDLMRNASLSLFQVGSIDAGSASAGRFMSFLDSNINFGTITNEFQPSNVGGLAIFGTNTGQLSINRTSANNNNLLTATIGCNIKFQMSLLINPTNATNNTIPASNSQFIVNIPSGTGGTTQVFSNLGAFFATSTINISSFAIGGSALNGVLNTTDLFSGFMSEIVGYNRIVSVAERQSIESYLRNKWF